jgi:multidrug efflux pump subunit AcrA (membrane-fusion protein)
MNKRWAVILLLVTALVGCRRSPTPTPTPIATAPAAEAGRRSSGGAVVASGEVVPAQETRLSFAVSGRVQTVAVARGDAVEAGDKLVTLDTTVLEANVRKAEAALAAAGAQLALLKAGPRPEEVAAAQAQLEAARAALAQAAAQRDQPDVGAVEAEVAAAQAQVAAAMADRREAEAIHDKTMTCVNVTLPGGEKREICPALGPIEEQARYGLLAAEAAQAAAQAQLDALLAGADAEVRVGQAGVWAAAAQRDAAQAQLGVVQAGASGEEIAMAEAAVAQAEAAVEAARAALDQATLRAPHEGTISALEVAPGEGVMPGQAVLTLADLHHLRVETSDLSELDVARVAAGQAATVYVEALGAEVGGRVVRIAAQATVVGGDVTYAVVVGLDEQPAGLRWGMSVEVEIATE